MAVHFFVSDDEPLLGEWLRDTLSSAPPTVSPSPQPPARKKSEGGDIGDSGAETTPTGRSFQMAPEEVSYTVNTLYVQQP